MTREELNEKIQHEIDDERNREKLKKIIKVIVKTSFIVFILAFVFYSYTTYISTMKIKTREYRVINEKIPTNFNGLKIIQISDLHYGSTMFQDQLRTIKKMVNVRKPDLVLFTGDLIDKKYKINSEEQEKIIKELKEIKASLGKYAVLGDEDNDNAGVILNHSEFVILKDDYDLIYQDTVSPILLIGLSSETSNPDIEKAFNYFNEETHNANIYTIAMFHEPDLTTDFLENHHADLLIAGHSHNGNIRVPFINYSLFKVSGANKYDQDYYEINDSKLYISSGLGTPSGIRLFCRPSINFFRLSNN